MTERKRLIQIIRDEITRLQCRGDYVYAKQLERLLNEQLKTQSPK